MMGSDSMDPKIAAFTVNGLAAATFTPYAADGSVDVQLVEGHAADLAKNKVHCAFINGTTGDSMCLSSTERKALAVAWVASGKRHGVKIGNHIGTNSISDSMDLAAHSESIGCDFICSMPPFFFKPGSARVLAQWMKQIGAAAPNTPLYYYHFPAITGVNIDPLELILQIEDIGVPTFRGMKFTEFNLWHYSNCVTHANGRYDMCYGRDEAMLGGLALGAVSSIGNAFCFDAGVYHRLRAAFFKGDLVTARKEQAVANSVVNIMNDARFGGNGLVISRHILEMKGVKLGPPRLPFLPMTPAQTAALEAELKRIEYFSWCD